MIRMSASKAFPRAVVILLALGLPGCSSSLYGWHVRTNSSPLSPSFNPALLGQQSTAIFGALAQPGLLGTEIGIDAILAQIIGKVAPNIKLIAPRETYTLINRNGLAGTYTQMRNDALQSNILDRGSLQKLGAAIGARYAFQPRLTAFTQFMTNRWSFTDVRLSQTRSSIMRMSLQLWDMETGELLWASLAETTVENEAVAQEPVYFEDAARLTLGSILADLLNGRTASKYDPLNEFIDQLIQIPQAVPKPNGGEPAKPEDTSPSG
jgi:hypothetical protein